MKAAIWIAVSSKGQAADDKISLPEQRKVCERYAADNGLHIVETLAVEGESRAAIDIVDFDSLPTAYHTLRQLWIDNAINALICYEFSRLGRSQSLLTYVLENCVRNGISIHVVSGGAGVIDDTNYRGQIAIGGFSTTSHMDGFTKKVRASWERMAARGLPATGRVPFTHKIIRDERGKIQRVIVDPDQRPLLNDLARLLLARVGWGSLGDKLAELGHYNERGKPYYGQTLYDALHSPTFWGNQGLGLRSSPGLAGMWVFDPTVPTPDGVMMWYDTELSEPAYTGELAAAIQDELRRRVSNAARARGDEGTRMFTGLLVCQQCGGAVNMRASNRARGYVYYGCRRAQDKTGCNQSKLIRVYKIREFVTDVLEGFLQHGIQLPEPHVNHNNQLDMLSNERSRIKSQIQTLIRKQAAAPDNVSDMYDNEIDHLSQRLQVVNKQYAELYQDNQKHRVRPGQHYALDELRETDLDKFWQWSEPDINQLLHRLLGNWRLTLYDGVITGLNP